jgi:hypothetical protein
MIFPSREGPHFTPIKDNRTSHSLKNKNITVAWTEGRIQNIQLDWYGRGSEDVVVLHSSVVASKPLLSRRDL